MDDAGDVDSIGGWVIEDDVRPNNECAEILAEVFATLAHLGMIRQRLQGLEQFVEHIIGGTGIVPLNVIANSVEITICEMG